MHLLSRWSRLYAHDGRRITGCDISYLFHLINLLHEVAKPQLRPAMMV
jgi:hypothetical protein